MMEAASTSKTSVNFYQFIFILAAVTTWNLTFWYFVYGLVILINSLILDKYRRAQDSVGHKLGITALEINLLAVTFTWLRFGRPEQFLGFCIESFYFIEASHHTTQLNPESRSYQLYRRYFIGWTGTCFDISVPWMECLYRGTQIAYWTNSCTYLRVYKPHLHF
jgi:hypothetical protein